MKLGRLFKRVWRSLWAQTRPELRRFAAETTQILAFSIASGAISKDEARRAALGAIKAKAREMGQEIRTGAAEFLLLTVLGAQGFEAPLEEIGADDPLEDEDDEEPGG